MIYTTVCETIASSTASGTLGDSFKISYIEDLSKVVIRTDDWDLNFEL